MKQTILAAAIMLASTQAFATNDNGNNGNNKNYALKSELSTETSQRISADKGLQSQIDQKGYDINTQAKRIDQTNTNVSNLNNKVDSYATQGAAAYAELKGTQSTQQSQLNAVQNAAQIANEKGDANAVRADGIEKSLAVTDSRSIDNAVRLDGAENAIRETNGAVSSVNADLQNSKRIVANELGKTNTAVKSVDDKVNVAINAQTDINNNQAKVNTAVQGQVVTLSEVQQAHGNLITSNTKQLANHETRITNIEDYSRDMDTRLSGRLDSQQSEIQGLKRDVNKVGNIAVGALAVAGHQFSTDYQAGPQVALSGATMGGYHSVAVGFGGAVSENLFLNAAFTSAGSQTGAVVSGTYRLR